MSFLVVDRRVVRDSESCDVKHHELVSKSFLNVDTDLSRRSDTVEPPILWEGFRARGWVRYQSGVSSFPLYKAAALFYIVGISTTAFRPLERLASSFSLQF